MFRFTIRDLLWLTVVVACACVKADEPGPTLKELVKQESGKRGSPPYMVRSHLRYHVRPHLGNLHFILVISWFKGSSVTAIQYSVDERGVSENELATYRSTRNYRKNTLPADDLKRLTELLPKLPESKAEPPIERTVYVSFQSGDKWRTETYDAAALPDEFEAAMKIIGERSETKDRHKTKAK